ncbi:ABC-three component system protein [uncultured Ruminococcus sp.]|uniref:ABC-three component system protein n=1 Tax=uncultured Ruminococcus sp. TaxID=165186 RepID=UPI00292DE493|nr:ABC-three component system protein [uncultured Ruminococcus sp.]
MTKAINDATLTKAGDTFQHLIALKDCFDMESGETLQIEVNGDVSVINSKGGRFQKEVKHHFDNQTLSDRSIDFWKTLANWYEDYDRIKDFTCLILYTTACVEKTSFDNWNKKTKEEKLVIILEIGKENKKSEETFRKQYNRIFNANYNKERLLNILDRFRIDFSQTSLVGISNDFAKHIGYIPTENRDAYIGALLGLIQIKVKDPPHKWEVTREEFDELLQSQTAAYATKGIAPLPNEFAKTDVPLADMPRLKQKTFVAAIREINYDQMIPSAISDYWKADTTIAKYFQDNIMYLQSLDSYIDNLSEQMRYTKENSELDAEGITEAEQIKASKHLYNDIMRWDAKDFGSIVRNQGYFQRGVIHNIVDESDFNWRVGGEKDEHQ